MQLRKLMLDAMAGLSTLFASANEDSDEAGGDCAKDSVQRRVPLWRKLLRLTGKNQSLDYLAVFCCF